MGDNTQDGGLSVGLRARPVLVLGLSLEARSETFLGIFSTQDGGLSVGPRARPVLVLGLSMEARDGGLSVGLRARPVLVLGLSMEARGTAGAGAWSLLGGPGQRNLTKCGMENQEREAL
ncbi:unnamed protein product [Pleuronectes platessa]|uniref:Uncharacterized protein n=1 Tax=Pleuronectes platessa TaxID=8262 RepID=A0A9N7W285_PLEPL|nr:unnamed protein product [Pleuronectes platessa]